MGMWGRSAGLIATLCCLAAACGNNDVNLNNVNGDVEQGFFIGQTEEGGDLSIAAGSVHAIFFECGGNDASVVFTPPEPVAGDGSFAVEFTDAGRHFTVTGRFHSQNHVEGRIEGDVDCDGHFEADRCNESRQDCADRDNDQIPDEIDPDQSGPQRTPTRTPTPAAVATQTAGATTETSAPTPTRTASPSPIRTSSGLCGNGMVDTDEDEECDPTATPQFDRDVCGGADTDPCVCDTFCADDDTTTPVTCDNRCRIEFDACAVPSDCSF